MFYQEVVVEHQKHCSLITITAFICDSMKYSLWHFDTHPRLSRDYVILTSVFKESHPIVLYKQQFYRHL